MASKKQIFRGSALLTLNEVVGNGCTFIRNFILARVLTKGDFGIAATLTIVISLLEIGGKLAFAQQVVRSKNGGDKEFLGTAHFVQFLLGLASSLLILAFATPFARALKVPELSWAIQLLAIVPVCSAFNSLEPFNYVRKMAFARSVWAELLPQIVTTLAAYPLAVWLNDFRVLLWLLISKAGLTMVVSHLVSGLRYRWSFRSDYFWEMIRFGGPIFLESFLMFGIFQGDRLLVAGTYSLSDLGGYAVASTIAALPAIALWKIFGGVGLPFLAQVQEDRPSFETRYALLTQLLAIIGGLFALLMVFNGESIIVLVFGGKYDGIGVIAACLCCGQAIRIVRGGPTVAVTALGNTVGLLVMSVMRLSGLLFAIPVIWKGGSLFLVACAGLGGEIVSLAAGAVFMQRSRGIRLSICFRPTMFVSISLGLAAALKWGVKENANQLVWLGIYLLSAIIFAVLFLVCFRETRAAAAGVAVDIMQRFSGAAMPILKDKGETLS